MDTENQNIFLDDFGDLRFEGSFEAFLLSKSGRNLVAGWWNMV